MRKYLTEHLLLSLNLLIIAGVFFVGSYIVHTRLASLETALTTRIAYEEAQLVALEDITNRNGVDESISGIISDCPRRSTYDDMLSRLGSLSKVDLITMQQLFESCSPYFPGVKALMVAKLEWEYNSFVADNTLLGGINRASVTPNLTTWKTIIETEKDRSMLLAEQTDIQGKIILELISGSRPDTVSVVELVAKARTITQSLLERGGRIETLRNELKS